MDFIYEKEKHVPNSFCAELIDFFENNKHEQIEGATVGGVDRNIKVSIDLPLTRMLDSAQFYNNKILEYVNIGIENYKEYIYENNLDMKKRLFENLLDSTFIGLAQIQKTEPSGFYRWHHDAFLPKGSRLLTYILYLNDVDEGCGGNTEFVGGKSIRPEAGKLVIFPATWTYYHRGGKLNKGVKYIATSFIWCEPPNEVI